LQSASLLHKGNIRATMGVLLMRSRGGRTKEQHQTVESMEVANEGLKQIMQKEAAANAF